MNTARRFGRLAAVITLLAAVVIAQDAGKFTDKRDGKTYKKVTIGKQVWMAENLNYDVPNVKTDVCYDNKPENCARFGRLYDWKTAKEACPAGWHLPSDAEWDVLMVAVGGSGTAWTKLKSTSGWKDRDDGSSGNGTDQYGFSALPGGLSSGDGIFYSAGNFGYWWSATENAENDAYYAWGRYMGYDDMYYVDRINGIKTYPYSVRCVQDTGGQK